MPKGESAMSMDEFVIVALVVIFAIQSIRIKKNKDEIEALKERVEKLEGK